MNRLTAITHIMAMRAWPSCLAVSDKIESAYIWSNPAI
jgi:hypothetical protein